MKNLLSVGGCVNVATWNCPECDNEDNSISIEIESLYYNSNEDNMKVKFFGRCPHCRLGFYWFDTFESSGNPCVEGAD